MRKIFLLENIGYTGPPYGYYVSGLVVVADDEAGALQFVDSSISETNSFSIRCVGEAAKDVEPGVLLERFEGE